MQQIWTSTEMEIPLKLPKGEVERDNSLTKSCLPPINEHISNQQPCSYNWYLQLSYSYSITLPYWNDRNYHHHHGPCIPLWNSSPILLALQHAENPTSAWITSHNQPFPKCRMTPTVWEWTKGSTASMSWNENISRKTSDRNCYTFWLQFFCFRMHSFISQ